MLIDAVELHRICMPDTSRRPFRVALFFRFTRAPRVSRVFRREGDGMTRTLRPELLHRARLTTQVLRHGLDFREIDRLREITRL